ncbi:hypothetical protein NDU88_002330 [Pleurodeles waltl]|uniref:Uncharacterized protein n=1 Tax=Pleurodeles waltl TaxID=8319 RepID=A0AAV7P6D8_PLEWA|nr:hypothetical protein NDU88_002330 [Pleurodeles waltl]
MSCREAPRRLGAGAALTQATEQWRWARVKGEEATVTGGSGAPRLQSRQRTVLHFEVSFIYYDQYTTPFMFCGELVAEEKSHWVRLVTDSYLLIPRATTSPSNQCLRVLTITRLNKQILDECYRAVVDRY